MQTNRAAMTARKRLKIAQRLRLLQYAKRERFIRERHIYNVVRSHLNEHAARRSAFMELSSRVEEARPIAGGCRHVQRIAKVSANRLNQVFVLRRLHDVIEHRDVVARMREAEVRRNEALNRHSGAKLSNRIGVAFSLQT